MSEDNVRSLSEAKKKKQDKDKEIKGPKKTFPEICNMYAHQINGTIDWFGTPFPDKFLAVKTETPGQRLVIKLGPSNTARDSSLHDLANYIATYGREIAAPILMDAQLTKKRAVEVADFWLSTAEPISMPLAFAFKSDPRLCFHRLDFDPSEGPHPTWDAFLGNMIGADMFTAFIGSVLDDRSYGQQYFWLHGEGGDGKGAMIRALGKLLGRAAISQQAAPMMSNKHWATPFMNVRLVCFTDFSDYSAVNKPALMALSGGDKLWADPKNEKAFQFQPIAKLIYCSNGFPVITGAKSDRRRLLLGRMKPHNNQVDPHYEDRLWAEIPHFIYTCMKSYASLCPDHGPIPVTEESQEEIENLIAVMESPFQTFFDAEFIVDPDSVLLYEDVEKKMRFRWQHQLSQVRLPFFSWLEGKGIRHRKNKSRGPLRDKVCFFGISLKGGDQ